MRDRLIFGTAALLLASAMLAGAQDKPSQDTTSGTIDVGGRFTSTTGDEARYERFRDLRDGANVNVLFSKQTPNWTFDLKASNIGYRDQNYVASFMSHRVKASVRFDQTPLNYAYYSRTPFNCTEGNCSLDPGLRAQVQGKTAIGIPQTVANLGPGSVFNSIAHQFDLQSRRDTIAGEARISATNNFDVILGFNTYKRTGNQPLGASFAFNVADELPIVIDNRETEI
jgi:Putative outer membrane beta-barrel porin, MtrB/PioB